MEARSSHRWQQAVVTEDWWGTPVDQRRLRIVTPTDDLRVINTVGCITYFSVRYPNRKARLKPDVALD